MPTVSVVGLEDSRQPGPHAARGRVLHAAAGRDVFQHDRVPVTGPAAAVASHVWWVRWRRPRRTPWTQQLLTDPVAHLTVEQTGPRSTTTGQPPDLHGHPMPAALLHGPVTRLWTVELPRQGRTSGIAFHPGGLAALLDLDAGALAGRVLPAELVVPGFADCREQVLATEDEAARRLLLQSWVAESYAPVAERVAQDVAYRTVRRAIEVMASREHVTVSTVADAVSTSPRSLHRWFARYVGVSPLRVLRRHRLQDAAAALDSGECDLTALAAALGWSDHAHFTREFRAVVGIAPQDYRRGARDRQ